MPWISILMTLSSSFCSSSGLYFLLKENIFSDVGNSNKVVIDVNKIAKRYRLGSYSKSYDTLFGKITSMITKPLDNYKFKKFRDFSKDDESVFGHCEVPFKLMKGGTWLWS